MSKNVKPARPRQITQAVRAGLECDDATGCVVPPIHLTSTFAFRGFGQKRDYDYTRSGNPTRDLLGAAIADLELGVGAVVTATGMAAITLVGYLTAAPTACSTPGTSVASATWSS
jgi:cystathionine gamma-synthase